MSYTVKNSGTRKEMLQDGLRDCQGFLGNKFDLVISRLQNLMKDSRDAGSSLTKTGSCALLALSFVGIRGLPAIAMIRFALRGEA